MTVARLLTVASMALIACATPSNAPEESVGAETIGPEGGRVTTEDVIVDVPAGALGERVAIAVSADATAPSGYEVDGHVYRFSPAGLHFAQPITVSFPAGRDGHAVLWTRDGDEARFEGLATTFEDGRAVVHPTHFSEGFVGTATTGVTCTYTQRVISTCDANGVCACTSSTTNEPDVRFWFASVADVDLESSLATDSVGINRFYLSQSGMPIFHATDPTHAKYVGYEPSREYVLRTDATIDVHEDAARFGTPPRGCESVPLIAVSCRGTTTIDVPPPPPPPPPAPEAGTDAGDGGAGDAGEAGAGDGGGSVSCTYKQRVTSACDANGVCTCTQSTTVEPNVHLWFASTGDVDNEASLATDSVGINWFYLSQPGSPIFHTTDATHAKYTGYDPSSEYVLRSGATVDVYEDAARFGTPPRGCESVPLIEVHCRGTTTLGK